MELLKYEEHFRNSEQQEHAMTPCHSTKRQRQERHTGSLERDRRAAAAAPPTRSATSELSLNLSGPHLSQKPASGLDPSRPLRGPPPEDCFSSASHRGENQRRTTFTETAGEVPRRAALGTREARRGRARTSPPIPALKDHFPPNRRKWILSWPKKRIRNLLPFAPNSVSLLFSFFFKKKKLHPNENNSEESSAVSLPFCRCLATRRISAKNGRCREGTPRTRFSRRSSPVLPRFLRMIMR